MLYMAQLVVHNTSNVKVAGSSPALGTSRHGPPIHPAAKWVPSVWIRIASSLVLYRLK